MRRVTFLACLALAGVAAAATYQPTVVSGHSMEPTLRSGQVVFLDRTAYLWRRPRRGDVIVVRHGRCTLIKRVYAGPGETFLYTGSALTGIWPLRAAALLQRRRKVFGRETVRAHRFRLRDDQVFVVGDNAGGSEDSRDFGPLPASAVLGRVRLPTDQQPLLECEGSPVPRRVRYWSQSGSRLEQAASGPGRGITGGKWRARTE